MYFIFDKARKNDPTLPIRSSVGLMLLLYVAVFLFSPGLVHHSEHDHIVHEEDTCKNDPCHVSIYHPGAEGSCNHKFHFTKDHEKCPWCDVTLARHLVPTDAAYSSNIFFYSTTEERITVFPTYSISFTHSGRGPPAFL